MDTFLWAIIGQPLAIITILDLLPTGTSIGNKQP